MTEIKENTQIQTPLSPLLKENLKNLPNTAGVYEMKNENDETLYIGKAKNLKSRVKSYFANSAEHTLRIQKLVEKIHHIEWTQTSSEIEALLLETNLIKEKNPKFNILMRDDKNFSYIKVHLQEDFPRITLTRKVLKDGAKYFGPKTSSGSVRKTIDLLQDIFHFRSSSLEISEISTRDKTTGNMTKHLEIKSGNQKYPCLNFHLNKCDAPCIGKISKEQYREKIDSALNFLKGDSKKILNSVKEKMGEYAKVGKFELAAKMRDKMIAIENISEKQIISAPDEFSSDIIGSYYNFGHVFFHLFSVRTGKIINSETFFVRLPETQMHQEKESSGKQDLIREAFFSFLRSHPDRVADAPKSIICNTHFFQEENNTKSERIEIWESFFLEKFQHRTEISLPQKGKRKKLLDLAEQNAENYAKRHSAKFLKNEKNKEETLQKLQAQLKMQTIPSRMECYDISHFSGQKTVASMVVFEDGVAKNSDYRSFNIKTLKPGEIDDFSSLEEAVARRLAKLPEIIPEDWKVENIKTKKQFGDIAAQYLTPPQKSENILCSEVFFSEEKGEEKFQKNTQKKIESRFYSLSCKNPERKIVSTAFVKKNTLLKTAEIFLGSFSEQKQYRFFLNEIFTKLRCGEYFVHTQEKEIQDFLESLGFTHISDQKLYGKYKSPKNDSFTKVPDIMLIDGGKGQLSSVAKALLSSPYGEQITLCSLAKREEEIFLLDTHTAEITLTDIKKNSPEGHLLQEIRDEAHRFAITKNRIGREKNAMKSVLDDIKGLGPKTKKLLKQKGGVPAIRTMSDEELLQIVSEKVLQQLREKI